MRRDARELAFKLIFERLFIKKEYSYDEEFFASIKKEEDKTFASEILTKFENNKDELSSLVSSHLIGYEIDRVYKVDLALIFECLTEIKYLGTPVQVAINETIELAKLYSTEKSNKFINGVLSAILKDKQ